MKLFYFYIGGKIEGALTELHDARFACGETIEDTFEELRKSWWGKPASLHLDCWGELASADGCNVFLRREPSVGEDKLWFVNLGGYIAGDFSEHHKNLLIAAPTESKAKAWALKNILDWRGHHVDNVFEVENIYDVGALIAGGGWHIHLEKTKQPKPFDFELGYWTIGKPDPKKIVMKKDKVA